MPRIGDKNTQATINRIKADGHISGNETKALSKAVLKDLAKADNAPELMTKIGENLELLAQAMEAGDIKMAPNGAASWNISDLASELEDAVETMEELGVGGAFMAALGIAQVDDYISVGEMDGLSAVAKSIVEGATDKGAAAASVRKVLSFFADNVADDDKPIDEVMAKSTQLRFEKLGLHMGRAVARHIDDAGDMKIGADSFFAKSLVQLDPYSMSYFLPRVVQAELSAYSSEGLTGPAKLKMDEAQQKAGAAMLKFIDEAPNMRGRDAILGEVYAFVTGEMFPPDEKDAWMDRVRAEGSDDLRDAVVDMQGMSAAYAARGGAAYQNKAKALKMGIGLIKEELDRRGFATPGAPGGGGGATSLGFALGVDLTSAMRDEIQGEWAEVTRSVDYIKTERAADPSIPEPHFMEVYLDALRNVAMGGTSTILEAGGLSKDKTADPKEMIEVGLSLDLLVRMGGHDALVKTLRAAVVDQMPSPDFVAEDVFMVAMTQLGLAP